MIQIDMPMPEKCDGCIFCNDNCSCVASDYDGFGINVGCAYRTGRRDIRCPLKEQEAVKPLAKEDDTYECICGAIVGRDELDASGIVTIHFNYCPFCGRAVKWDA